MDKERAKEEIRVLLERYNQIVKKEREIKSKEEEMTKKDLIRPLFERVLGWNFEEDVTAEEKISKGWVDYGFRMNDIPKFFLEAKALREDLDNPNFFQQAVNYAWYKGCTWAVLTNFETLKILNAEWEAPNYLYSHFMTIKCSEFLDRFNDLWLLSKESFEQGLLDELAEKFGKRTKKTTVDKQLLDDFTRFRDMLSKNIAKLNRNKKLTEEELDESVQRILNRLIFIRNCEDRGLEEKKLWEAKNEAKVWKKVKEVFAYYDKNYDSKLFTYDPADSKNVHLCDKLDVDDGVMREIVDGLYRTKDKSISYDFSIIDADVLGTVYEQYLSHILKKTERRAKLTENHAHKKEQGIYYTPIYVVDYIVRRSLGELLKDKKVNAEKIRVLDPACGSGSFLIKAFDILNEYCKNSKDYNQTQLDTTGTGSTYSKKLGILRNNIFGVDLDKQAVEIAQLNLLLKIAEKRHRLPLLEQNIKCGNSLVDDEKVAGDKAFKWEEEFKGILKEGGFDIIIGNPPYVKEFVNRKIFEDVKRGSSRVAKYYEGKMDYLYFFIELGIDLLKEGGYLSFITTNYWLQAEGARNLREKILRETTLVSVFDFNEFTVFEKTGQHNLVLVLRKMVKQDNKTKVTMVRDKETSKTEVIESLRGKNVEGKIDRFDSQPQSEFLQNKGFKIAFVSDRIERICEKIKSQQNYLLSKKDVAQGIIAPQEFMISSHLGVLHNKTVGEGIFTLSTEELERLNLSSKENELIKPFFTTENIGRYFASDKNARWLIYTDTRVIKEIDNYPKIKKHLEQFKQVITSDFGPYGLHRARVEKFFLNEKIMCLRKTSQPAFSYVDFPCYVTQTFFIIQPKDINLKYLTAILNSKLIHFWLYFKGKREGNQLQIDKAPILNLPIKTIPEEAQQPIIELVDRMLILNKRLGKIGAKTTDERTKLEDEIRKTDSEIHEIVYKIYGITESEKQIIEIALGN